MTNRGERAVFLDRDGVLNEVLLDKGKPRSPRSMEEFRLTPKAYSALELLRTRGFRLIVVTNQPEVVRGYQTRTTVEMMHRHLASVLPVDEIRTCYHDEQHDCECRKPKPGMLIGAANSWGLDLSQCFIVGDRNKDIAAGRSAGCRTVLIQRWYNAQDEGDPDYRVSSIEEAAKAIVAASEHAAVTAA